MCPNKELRNNLFEEKQSEDEYYTDISQEDFDNRIARMRERFYKNQDILFDKLGKKIVTFEFLNSDITNYLESINKLTDFIFITCLPDTLRTLSKKMSYMFDDFIDRNNILERDDKLGFIEDYFISASLVQKRISLLIESN